MEISQYLLERIHQFDCAPNPAALFRDYSGFDACEAEALASMRELNDGLLDIRPNAYSTRGRRTVPPPTDG